MGFWKKFKNYINNQDDSETPSPEEQEEPILLRHELIERNEEELDYYAKWNDSNVKTNMLNWIHEQYNQYQKTCTCEHEIHFLMIPSMNGFVMQCSNDRWAEDDFRSLFDYFKHRMRDRGYRTQVSDVKCIQKGNCIELTERHYLKPPRQPGTGYGEKVDQKFGNIMISLNCINKKMVNLKFSATHYNDQMYHPAQKFSALMDCVCG